MSEEQKTDNVEQAAQEVAHEEAPKAEAKDSTASKKETKDAEAKAEAPKKVKAEEAEEKAPKAEAKREEKESSEKATAAEEEKAEAPKAEKKEAPAEAESKKEEPAKAEASEEKKSKPAAKKPAKTEKPSPGDFDWDSLSDKGFGDEYSDKEKEEMEKLYVDTLSQVEEKAVIKGVVVGITEKDVILNIGYKSDGIVSKSEFKDTELKEGDEVEVYLETQEDKDGQIVLSRRKANIVNAWENIKNAHEQDTVIEGYVKRRTKGGLIVDVFGVESFLPGSQIDVKPIRDFDVFVGKNMEVKVVKINYSNDNVVVSHKVLIEKDIEEQKTEILNNLEKGQVLEGIVKNMTNFGVFIDLGGVDGLLHITDISWGRINHPEEVLKLDQSVQVVVLDFDDEKKRISLGMKQLSEHPWDSLPKDIEVGSKVKGKIVNVADYGAFLEILPGVEGYKEGPGR